MYAIDILLIQRDKALILAGLPTDTGAGDDCSLARKIRVDGDSRISQCLPGGDYGELGKAIQQRNFTGLKMRGRIIAMNFRAILETQVRCVHQLNRSYAGLSGTHGLPGFAKVVAQRADDAQTGNCHTMLHHVPAGAELSLRVSLRTVTSCRTSLRERATSSETEILNSPSIS